MKKVQGFNSKEQKLVKALSDGEPHGIKELKKLFIAEAKVHCHQTYEKGWGDREVDIQAQSFVRNSIRRLIRDGLCQLASRGVFKISIKGKNTLKKAA